MPEYNSEQLISIRKVYDEDVASETARKAMNLLEDGAMNTLVTQDMAESMVIVI
jgi:hypothetical protein